MSARARRFFGCVLPVTLAVFGCAAIGLLAYATQVAFQLVPIDDRSMLPVLEPGWTVLVNNTAFWARDPLRGSLVSLDGDDGIELRRLFAVPGDTIRIRDGVVYQNGDPTRVINRAHGDSGDYGPIELGPGEYFVMAEDRAFDDSREWGPLQRDELFGVALFYFPEGSRSPMPVDPTAVPIPTSGPGVSPSATPPPASSDR